MGSSWKKLDEAKITHQRASSPGDHPNRLWIIGQTILPAIPAEGTTTPIMMSDDGGIWSTVFPKRTAVEVMVVKPSERRNQAARYLNVFLSFLISEGRSTPPRRFQALMISRGMLHCSSAF
ncbi:hypothetical protein QCA50_014966 [Cerrena zonata]|uniref:Uncharacterized protein n=1 Tax=Cerrena zonata TaxID=2478898 RepID=A0AAW0FXG1_9APHY